jgi:RHH-type proline utilization regulon transcriptional repressor/proline dehydrogenase/delta 1-pyrroline-5-carboxylate dehydrogenase
LPEDPSPASLRRVIRARHLEAEGPALDRLVGAHAPDAALRSRATARATALVQTLRREARPGLMEVLLAEYGLSTDEGVALM